MRSINELDAVILCGGLGTRLKSVTDDQKVMANVGDRPFLDIQIEQLKSQGIERVVLCTGYQAQDVENYYRENTHGITIDFAREEEPLGTGGAIKNAKELIQSDPFFGLNGDCFCPVDLKPVLEFHNSHDGFATLVLAPAKDKRDFGGVVVDDQKRITAFQEKGSDAKYFNAGLYCFNQEVFDIMPTDKKFSIEYDVFEKNCDDKMYGYTVDQEFLDIGTPDRLSRAQEELKDK